MKINQLSIFLENRAGCLSAVLEALARANINILGLSLADTSDFGILRIVVGDEEKAMAVLQTGGFTSGITQVVAAALPDHAGALNAVLAIVARHGINVEYMYSCPGLSPGRTIMIFRFDRLDEAIEILQNEQEELLVPAARLRATRP